MEQKQNKEENNNTKASFESSNAFDDDDFYDDDLDDDAYDPYNESLIPDYFEYFTELFNNISNKINQKSIIKEEYDISKATHYSITCGIYPEFDGEEFDDDDDDDDNNADVLYA